MVDSIQPTKDQKQDFKRKVEERFVAMIEEYKEAPYTQDRARPTRDDARAAVLAEMTESERQLFTTPEVAYEDLQGLDKLGADVSRGIGDAWSGLSSTVSDVTSTVIGQPTAGIRSDLRERAQELPAESEQVGGNAILSVAGFAAPYIERFTGSSGAASKALSVIRGQEASPIAGITNQDITGRFSTLSSAIESFGIDLDNIEEYGINAGAAAGLLGRQSDIDDARDLVNLVDGALKEYGLENILGTVDGLLNMNLGFTTVEKEIQKMPEELSVPVMAAKGLVDSIADLRELIAEFDNAGTEDDRKKMIGMEISRLKAEIGTHINNLSETIEGIPDALEIVPGKRVHNLVRAQVREKLGEAGMEMLREPIVGSGLRAVGAAITNDEHMLERAFKDLSEADLEEYLPTPGPEATPEDHELHRKQKEFLSTTIEGIIALMTSKDASDVETKMERVVELAASETGKGGMFESEHVDLSEEASQIAEGAGKVLSGQTQDEEGRAAIGRAIGSEIVDQITGNPAILAGVFGATALGLGTIGGAVGQASGQKGMGALLGGSLPMMTPIILRGIMGDQYTEGMKTINNMMAPFTDKLFNMLPDGAFETPLLGNILGAARDNPLGTSLFTFGQLTGNDAFQDASAGMLLADMLYGNSTNRDDQAQAAIDGPAGQTSRATTTASSVVNQTSMPSMPAGTYMPNENVGATTRSTDASAAYALSLTDPRNHSRFNH